MLLLSVLHALSSSIVADSSALYTPPLKLAINYWFRLYCQSNKMLALNKNKCQEDAY